MKIFHVSAECYPVAKVGGLADVVGALPKYLNKLGLDASVIMPWYNRKFTQENSFEVVFDGVLAMHDLKFPFQIFKETQSILGFDLYLVKIEGLTDRENVYGYEDAPLQFIAFQLVVLYWIRETKNEPNVLHCHDHHSGLIPFMLKYVDEFSSINKNIKTVGTIHNGEYQGQMSWEMLKYIPHFDSNHTGLLDWNNLLNPLAAMVKCADAFTTVSEGYLHELFEHSGGGLEILFRQEIAKSYGIINGIDSEIWNPKIDIHLVKNYAATHLVSGKKLNKIKLCEIYKLDENLPLVAFIGRFAGEKGADLLPGIIERMIVERTGDVNFIVLGSGETSTENKLRDLQYRFSGNFALELGYHENLSHLIYAGADYLLMPSRVEPCGLNQMYAMAYGTIPIVRKTGGLKDTVPDLEEADGRGFSFNDADVNGACWAIHRALVFEKISKSNQQLRKKIMKIDFSWEKSAQKYIDLYKTLKN